MKSWLYVIIAAVVAFFGYKLWFAPEEEGGTTSVPSIRIPLESDQPAPNTADEASAGRRSLGLDTGAGPADGGIAQPPRDETAWALLEKHDAAVQEGHASTAKGLRTRILKQHAESDPARLLLFESGKARYQLYRQLGRSKEGLEAARDARRLMTPALFLLDADPQEKESLRRVLEELADAVLFSARHVDGVDRVYTPKSGENLDTLRRKTFKAWGATSTPEFVAEINGMGSPTRMRAGEPLKVPLGKPALVVVKREYRIYMLLDGCYVRDYPIGLGREGSTPEATFEIVTKVENPDWFAPNGRRVPFGDPANILGTRWMGFKNTAEHASFGIHGTSEPDSIGRDESAGCIRMLRADVEELFRWIPRGTLVEIRRY
jgi:hypothetical protein